MKKNIPSFLLLVLIVLSAAPGIDAQHVVRGKVTEAETGLAVIGATVVEYDENERVLNGTVSDLNGNYVIKVSGPDATLKFSFVGLEPKTIELNSRTTLDVELASSTVALQEVVVTAEMETDPLTGQSIRDRTSATVKVDMDQMRNVSAVSVDDALQGQVTGLDIVSSGSPGSGSSIVIRGLGSLANSTPLIVVNGIAQNISIDQDFDFAGSDQEDIGQLLNIAPQDIKSIEVLKDAASTAVWGSKGADGVLLIETQKGSRGKTTFDYNYRFTYKDQPPPIPMLNGDEYITMQLEELQNAYGIFEVPDEIAYNPDYVDFHNYSANTNWINEVTQPGFNHDHYFKLSGGGEKTTFFASLNAVQEQGTTLNEGFRRLSTRINLDYKLSKKLVFMVFFDYTNSYKDGNYRNIRRMAYRKAPNMSIWEYDEKGNPTSEYFTPIESYQGRGDIFFNPVAIGNLSENDVGRNTFQNSYQLNLRVNRWLRILETISFQYENVEKSVFLPYTALGIDWLDNEFNRSIENNANNQRVSSRTQAIFTPIVTSVHSLTASLLGEVSQRKGANSQLQGRNGPSLDLTDPSSAPHIQNIRSGAYDERNIGALTSVNYKYRDKYIISAILRGDASSSFGSNHRWGLFPSFSLGWRFSNEPWFAGMSFMNNGMLRAGYGQAGKEPRNPYDRFGIFNTGNPSQYIMNPVVIPTQINLSNLKWQTVESYNLGIELALLSNRLTLTGDLYDKLTSDILWRNYEISSSSGFTRLKWFNGGKLRNRGWEASMRYNFIRTSNLRLTVNFNVSRNINSFEEFPENFNNLVGTSIGNGIYPRMAQIGQPVGSFYGFKYLGVYPTAEDAYAVNEAGEIIRDPNGKPVPMRYASGYKFTAGDAVYEDVNKDGLIDLTDVLYIGDSNPEYSGGFGLSGSWKRLNFSCQFFSRLGFDIVNEIAQDTEGMLDKNNQSKAVLYRWRKEGDNQEGMIPRAYLDHPANNLGSDRYVEAGDFLRLNNLSVSYQLNPSFVSRLRIDNLEIGINMRKIWTLTGYSGQDPEISQRIDDPFWFGTDNGLTPPPRVYSALITMKF